MRPIGWIAAIALLATPALAQPQRNFNVPIKTTDLGHRTYMLEGVGGNITAAVGTDGVIMVDSEFAPMHDKIKAAIDKVSGGKPINYLINTHFHGDHTGGNALFHKDGAIIIADANVTKRLMHPIANVYGKVPPPASTDALPNETYSSELALNVDGRTAVLTHMPRAHTDGDTYVYFPDANVLATGDIVDSTGFPNIDVRSGGGIDGMIAGVDRFVRLTNAQTKIVPGHGTLMTKADLQSYRKVLATVRDRIATLKKKGMTEDQVVAAKPLASDIEKQRDADDSATAQFERLVYQSVK
jgi:glyoxylase-like metal-dependent hydrolase (beta-lactamase superfamily II)